MKKHQFFKTAIILAFILSFSGGVLLASAVSSSEADDFSLPVEIDDFGLAVVAPTQNQMNGLIKQVSDGVITVDLSDIPKITGVSFAIDPYWFDGTGERITLKLRDGFTMTIGDNIFTQPVIYGGPVTVLFKIDDLSVSLIQNGADMAWYNFNHPILISAPYDMSEADGNYTLFLQKAAGEDNVIPRFWLSGGLVYARIYQTGSFSLKYLSAEDVGFADTNGFSFQIEGAVNYLQVRGILMDGDPSDGSSLFLPDSQVTRAEFITMLMRSLNVDNNIISNGRFSDILDHHEYARAVNNAKVLGIAQGTSNRSFLPDAPLSRQDMFVFTYRAMEIFNIAPDLFTLEFLMFEDWDDVPEYAASAVQNLAKMKLITSDDGYIHPAEPVKRSDAAIFLFNMLRYDAQR